jgi:SAM-dependent methyltransferase
VNDWDQRYAHGEHLDDQPSQIVVQAAEGLPPGRALDLACGPGRNAMYLATRGWQVTAVDSSPVALDIFRRRASDLDIDIRLADLERREFTIDPGAWDLICDIRYLQRDLFEDIRAGLRPGGIFVAEILLGEGRFRMAPGELRALFEDWTVLHYTESDVAGIVAVNLPVSSSRP